MKLPTERIAWIDVLKGLGIYLIYVVHLPGNTGNFNLFFMIFAVPLFFFAGGLTAQRSKERPFRVFLRDKTQKILIPYFAFGLLTMAVRMIVLPESKLGELIGWTKQLALGRRNNLFAASLWFLPCYFCVTLLYHGLQRVLKNQWLLLGVCTVLSLAVRFSIDAPLLPWGLDSAVRYLFYYALGDVLITPIERARNDGLNRGEKLIFAAVTGGVLWLNLLNYLYGRGYIPGLFGVTLDFNGQVIELIGMALVGLYAVVLLSL
ncbi:MAG: acyltransferase family protein, partial [Pygmaiobacter sp.]